MLTHLLALQEQKRARVKVYMMQENAWADMGTGQVLVTAGSPHASPPESSPRPSRDLVVVISEDTGSELLHTLPGQWRRFDRQENNIITWHDRGEASEAALRCPSQSVNKSVNLSPPREGRKGGGGLARAQN